MSSEPIAAEHRFPLRSRASEILLEDHGFRHPANPRSRRGVFTPYSEVTHLSASRRALWIGARRSVYVLPRGLFRAPEDADRFARALIERIARLPRGDQQLARMSEIEQRSRSLGSLRVTGSLIAACLVVFGLQIALGDVVQDVAHFSTTLVGVGETWRIVTGNLVHGLPSFPLHLVMNLIGLLMLGMLVERPLGTARTIVVVGGAVLGAALGCGLAGYELTVGASGIVFGFAGAVLWLELRCNEWLPAWWRFPRRPFLTLLALNVLLSLFVPIIAGMGHAGGFMGGLLATALVSGTAMRDEPPRAWTRLATAAVLAISAAAVCVAGAEILTEDDPLARRAERLLLLPEIAPIVLNNEAWMIAIRPSPTPAQIDAAVRLAERAVSETHHSDPNVLDTLAEALFLAGRTAEAILTIDDAIALAPHEFYFREQRRRFTGDRAPDDRPDPPSGGWLLDPRTPARPAPEPGVTV